MHSGDEPEVRPHGCQRCCGHAGVQVGVNQIKLFTSQNLSHPPGENWIDSPFHPSSHQNVNWNARRRQLARQRAGAGACHDDPMTFRMQRLGQIHDVLLGPADIQGVHYKEYSQWMRHLEPHPQCRPFVGSVRRQPTQPPGFTIPRCHGDVALA
jgi:hypothetical protein